MKLGLVLFVPFVAGVLGACSDPPAAPAEAAAWILVGRGNGTCNATAGQLAMPQDTRVIDRLACDLTQSCDPAEFIVVDGDDQTRITCSVTPSGNSYNVTASLRYQNNQITVSGAVQANGGPVQMTHYSRQNDVSYWGTCTLTIIPNRGVVAGGRIWATFDCPDFRDPSVAGGMDCRANGAFLFQKCGGG